MDPSIGVLVFSSDQAFALRGWLWMIADNLLASELRKLDSSAGYTDQQLEEIVELFELHQRKFGVVQLLYNTSLHVASLLREA